jgi:hypothetical protein
VIAEVWWEEDETKRRKVTGHCRRCCADGCERYDIVSPMGVVHHGAEHNEGYTACGIDATGPDWWWRT